MAEPGGYFTCEVDGEPVVVVKGEDGELRAYSNVCLHRAGPVARGEGNAKHFRCSYHGWSYGLDGCLLATPHFERLEGEDGCLPLIRVETWDPSFSSTSIRSADPFPRPWGTCSSALARNRLADLEVPTPGRPGGRLQLEGARGKCPGVLPLPPRASFVYCRLRGRESGNRDTRFLLDPEYRAAEQYAAYQEAGIPRTVGEEHC